MDTFASPPVDLRAFGVCAKCRSVSGLVVIGGTAWLYCARHQVRWICEGAPASLGGGGDERQVRAFERTAPVWLADFHPAHQRVEQMRAAVRPRILAGSASRRAREARAERRR